MSDNKIPFDIQIEILKKLPVKPLITFRSVSKQYKSLIDSPGFISGYASRDSHPHRRLLVSYKECNFNELRKYICFVDNDDDNSFTQQEFTPTIPHLFTNLCNFFDTVGSSHGLLCLYGYYKSYFFSESENEMLILWNPSIRKTIGISLPDMLGSDLVFGFGVCPVTNDPVVFKSIFNDGWQVEIFTLSSGIWKSVPFRNLPSRESVKLTFFQVVVDKFLYFVEDGKDFYRIVSFDLTRKEFGILDVPDQFEQRFDFCLTICKLKESLVVIESGVQNQGCDLWILSQEGVAKSFKKLFSIKTAHEFMSVRFVLGFKKNGDPIIVTEENDNKSAAELQVYERSSQNLISLGIFGVDYTFFVGPYIETLLLLDQTDCFIY